MIVPRARNVEEARGQSDLGEPQLFDDPTTPPAWRTAKGWAFHTALRFSPTASAAEASAKKSTGISLLPPRMPPKDEQ